FQQICHILKQLIAFLSLLENSVTILLIICCHDKAFSHCGGLPQPKKYLNLIFDFPYRDFKGKLKSNANGLSSHSHPELL
ncbi:MAG: hypothetical protein ACKN9E_09905, partial [Microcystaceae cyanobacterium]